MVTQVEFEPHRSQLNAGNDYATIVIFSEEPEALDLPALPISSVIYAVSAFGIDYFVSFILITVAFNDIIQNICG